MTSPAIDASGAGTGQFQLSSSGTATFSTTTSGDLAVCVIAYNSGNPVNLQRNVTSVAASGLTFSPYFQQRAGDGDFSTQEVWTAPISGTVTGKAVTVTMDGEINAACIAVFGVSGLYSTAAPWDPNGGLPVEVNSTNVGGTFPITITTTNANDLLLWILSGPHGHTGIPSGFTSVALIVNGSGFDFCELSVGVLSVSAVQSGHTYTASTGAGGALQPGTMAAFTADAAPPPASSAFPMFVNT